MFPSHAIRAAALSLFIVLFSVVGQAQAQRITLRISHMQHPDYWMEKAFLAPWAKELERRTRGRVKVELYNKDSIFGNIKRQASQVREGVIDIALGHRGFTQGSFKRTSVMELPFLVKHAGPGSQALWQLHKEGLLGDDYKGLKVLSLFVHTGGQFHTALKPITNLEDLKGLRVRTSSKMVSAMLKFLGAKPVGLPPAAIYENLDNNAVDGAVTSWSLVDLLNLNDLVKYHTDAHAYTVSFFVVMNKLKYDALPEFVRKVIDDMSGDNLAPKFSKWWEDADRLGIEDARKRGNTIIPVSKEKRDQWRQQLKPMIEASLDRLEREGIANARQIYARAQQLVQFYEKQYDLAKSRQTRLTSARKTWVQRKTRRARRKYKGRARAATAFNTIRK